MDRLAGECDNLQTTVDMLIPWLSLDVPVEEISQLSQARCWTGMIPSQHLGQAKEKLAELGAVVQTVGTSGNKSACMIVALNEIAANMPGGKAGTVQKAMQRIGLTTPTLKLEKDVLTLMVRSAKYNKVISTDFSFSFTPDKKLRVSILQTRMGRLAMPDTFVRSHLEKLQNTLKAARPSPKTKPASRRSSLLVGLSSSQLGAVLAAVIAAVDQEPISTELLWPIRKKRVRVEGIEIDDLQLTLYVVPIDRITGG